MKLTWFGGTTMRVHIGGAMLVIDADGAPAGIDRVELVSGADLQIAFGDLAAVEAIDPERWTPRKAPALIDAAELPEVEIYRVGESVVVVDAPGEQPLLLVTGEVARMGRWAGNAVVVVLGEPATMPGLADNILVQLAPRLMAVAAPDGAVEQVMLRLANRLDGTGFMALEAGLALEV